MHSHISRLAPDPMAANRATLRSLINGYQVSQAIHAAAELRVAEHLRNGPITIDDLADKTRSDPATLYRLMRALASIGLFHESQSRVFSQTDLGEGLDELATSSLAAWARLGCRAPQWAAWGALTASIRSGRNAFTSVHGEGIWEYRSRHPEEGAAFDHAMREASVRVAVPLAEALRQLPITTLVDVGGGDGILLALLLAAWPHATGIVFDLAHVVSGAQAQFRTHAVANRARAVTGDFRGPLPSGADAYLLKAVLHDWEDDDAVRILRRCHDAMARGGHVVIVERLLAPANDGAEGKFSDINMLVNPGGRERTKGEFAKLLVDASLRTIATFPLGYGVSAIAAQATGP